ncbi:MAG: DUF3088 domain-containing protein [Acidobacteriota bacterium]
MTAAAKDQLFLLPPTFEDPAHPGVVFHCQDCSTVEGLLSYFPRLREQIDVHYIPFPKPRTALVELLGDQHQNCPTLVVGAGADRFASLLQTSAATGRAFCTDPKDITQYLMAAYGVSAPHP